MQQRRYLNQHAYSVSCLHEENRKKFILTPNWKDDHATVMVHILDPATGQVMVSIFMNSWDSKNYKDYICMRFNKKNYYSIYESRQKSKKNGPKRKKIKKSNLRKITESDLLVIDASHDLQTEEGDSNCTLYGYNFLKAIAEMLNNPREADQIFHLARLAQGDKNAQEKLRFIFRKKLKGYLPCYYNNDHQRSPSDLKAFHLMERWNLGSRILSTIYPPEFLKIKIKESVQPTYNAIISIFEKEKARLMQKYPQHKIERLTILDKLISQTNQNFSNFKSSPSRGSLQLFKASMEKMITTELNSHVLDKYSTWGEKLGLAFLNALSLLTIVTLPVKKLITGSWFFSTVGKTEEAAIKALTEIKNGQSPSQVL